MEWDFRIVKRKISGFDFYQVHRVFYSDAGKSKPILVENLPATIIGNGPKVMLEDIDRLVDSFDKNILVIPEWDRG